MGQEYFVTQIVESLVGYERVNRIGLTTPAYSGGVAREHDQAVDGDSVALHQARVPPIGVKDVIDIRDFVPVRHPEQPILVLAAGKEGVAERPRIRYRGPSRHHRSATDIWIAGLPSGVL